MYFFRDKSGQVLYIGKATNLRNRLASYFKPQLGGRTARLMEKAVRITWQETNSEIEALILESQLIKKHHPPFNVALRDDKQYFYVGFTNEKFPKIFLTHQPEADSRKPIAAIAGPFTDGLALKTTLRLLRRIFPYCACKQKHNNFCLNYHIGKCGGLCCLKPKHQSPNFQFSIFNFQNEYGKNIKAIKDILSGKKASLVKKFKKEMADLGKAGKFEEAIGLRDKIEKLEKVFENAKIIRYSTFDIPHSEDGFKKTSAAKELSNLLNHSSITRIEGYDISNIQGQFAAGAMVVFINGQPDKKEYRKFKIRSSGQILRHRKTKDLAMTQNQKPDDIAMLKEILMRRFKHPEWPWPDLIVVDGGRAQLNATRSVIFNFQFSIFKKIPIIALTKDNKHHGSHIYIGFTQHHFGLTQSGAGQEKTAIPLKKLPEQVKNLILRVDGEAHRFAIGYYRKLYGRLD